MNFTIKQKLISIIVLVTLGLITLYVESTFNQNYIALLNQTKSNLKEVQISMLQLRRNEKDFLLRQDKKYLDTFSLNFKSAQNAISKLKSSIISLYSLSPKYSIFIGDILPLVIKKTSSV